MVCDGSAQSPSLSFENMLFSTVLCDSISVDEKEMLLHQVLNWLLASNLFHMVQGHGYLIKPPSRNAAWRHGFKTPTNIEDNGLNCGGRRVQWGLHNGSAACAATNTALRLLFSFIPDATPKASSPKPTLQDKESRWKS